MILRQEGVVEPAEERIEQGEQAVVVEDGLPADQRVEGDDADVLTLDQVARRLMGEEREPVKPVIRSA